MAHTPAPWFTDRSRAVYVGNGTKVADTRAYDSISLQQAHDNARLIAAAPDMLATLKSVFVYMIEQRGWDLPITQQIADVITKAEGERHAAE